MSAGDLGPLDHGPPERKRMVLSQIVEPVHVVEKLGVNYRLVDVALLLVMVLITTLVAEGRC